MRNILKSMLVIFALCSTATAAEFSLIASSDSATLATNAILLNRGETLTYTITGTFTGTAVVEKSNDVTNWKSVGVSTTNNAGGTVTGQIEAGWFSSYYRINGTTITAGQFNFNIKDNDDLVYEWKNNKNAPVMQLYDESVVITGEVQATTMTATDLTSDITISDSLVFSNTFDVATTTPTRVNQLVIDSNFDVYISCGTEDLTGWIKVGGQ